MIKFEQSQKKEKYIFSKSRNIILLVINERATKIIPWEYNDITFKISSGKFSLYRMMTLTSYYPIDYQEKVNCNVTTRVYIHL